MVHHLERRLVHHLSVLTAGLLLAATPAFAAPSSTVPVHQVGVPLNLGSYADDFGVAMHLATENPADFSYPKVTSDGVVLFLTSPDSAPLAKEGPTARAARVKEVREKPAVGMLKRVPFSDAEYAALGSLRLEVGGDGVLSFAEAELVKNEITDLVSTNEFSDARPWKIGVDLSTAGVTVSANAATDTLRNALAAWTGPAKVSIEVDEAPVTAQPASRDYDWGPPLLGGARTESFGVLCSDSFSWRVSGNPAMLTAGHCKPNGGAVGVPDHYIGSVTAASEESWNDGDGSTPLAGAMRGDVALIRTVVDTAPKMYRGGITAPASGAATVRDMWTRRAAPGDTACSGGASSGEICIWTVTGVYQNVAYWDGGVFKGTARNVITTQYRYDGNCVIGGDSGGSVFGIYDAQSVIALGIISGRSTLLSGCSVIYTDVWDAYVGLPGSIATG